MNKLTLAAAAICAAFALPAHSAVPADEAAKLKTTLTPLGGEKTANADGSIPAWDGAGLKGYTGPKVGDIPAAPFADEKPVAQISAKNAAQYGDRLSDGTKALMQKYPDSFRIDVFPTHRTATAPDYVIANTFANASRCKTKAGGLSIEGCHGGVPFPIPKEGIELYWNYMLRIESEAVEHGFKNIVVSADGSRALATRNDEGWNFPYYYKDGSPEKWNGKYFLQRFNTTEPPFKAGESLVIHDSIDASEPRQAWQYLVGQRRVRRAPTVGYDTPDFVASGANYFDEVMGIFGAPDRYEWKLVGKKELYVPYNTNAIVTAKVDQLFAKHHLNPDKLRWELHRVWVVEATVAPGKRHAVPKRRYYFDEDSWVLLLADGYDAEGKLWRTTQMLPFVVPAVPAVSVKPAAVFNLQAGTLSAVQFLNEENYRVVPRKPESYYTGDAVAADNAR